MNKNLFRIAGWSAYLSAIATLAAFATLIIFFAVGDPFGIINDSITVIGSIVLIPVLLALYQLHRVHTPAASLGALLVGIIAVLFAGTLQALLVFRVITYAQTAFPVPLAYGVFGLSLAYYNYLACVHETFSRKLALWGVAAGIGYLVTTLGFILGGQNHPLTYIGGLTAIIAAPVWSIWIGLVWLKNAKG
jgi:MFS family permease